MKKYRIKAREYSSNDWVPEYLETSEVNGIVMSNPKSPSGRHFNNKNDADEETLGILLEQGIKIEEIQRE
jgi:hypothetical protein